ncbi:hypothetical protein MAM1_0010d01054 [Mucor ambiguus]|uniref:Uncharacterized protein n=1 Tax=Mucor ambiguus TaxID=91626 RepID=A0A0C9LQP9_9FUNG|nr:hypothetical protein MAM1_0010d01054 [Mucor ambiguus]
MPPAARKLKRQETKHDSTQKKAKSLEHTHTKFEALQRTIFANYLAKRFSKKADWKKVVWATSFRVKSTKLWACMYYNGVGGIRELDFEWSSGDFNPPNYKTVAYAKVLNSEINRVFTQYKQNKQEAILQTDPNCTDGLGYKRIHDKKKPLGGFIFGWPSKSMDLHPMTPIVQQFKERLPDLDDLSKADKSKAIKTAWEAVLKREITKSIDRMPQRLNAVPKRQGQAIDDDYYTYCLDPSEYQQYRMESRSWEAGVVTVFSPSSSRYI